MSSYPFKEQLMLSFSIGIISSFIIADIIVILLFIVMSEFVTYFSFKYYQITYDIGQRFIVLLFSIIGWSIGRHLHEEEEKTSNDTHYEQQDFSLQGNRRSFIRISI